MLTDNELIEIRTLLEKANEPLYLFDDDGDGLCSFLVLKKFYKKGRGKPIKNSGPLNNFYLDYMEEGKPDLIVILDKAVVKQEFIDESPCEVLYIDHHPLQDLKKVKYFNPLKHNKNIYLPTSAMAYNIVNSNLWLAVVGCLFDYYIPPFIKEFKKEYPDLIKKVPKDAGYIKFETELGKLVKIFSFNLKGKKSEVFRSLKAIEQVESPYEILNKTTENGKYLCERYERINREYERLLNEAKKIASKDKLLLFEYPSTHISLTSDLATEISYWYKNKTIIIAREKGDEMKISVRSQKKNVREPFAKAIEGLKAYGGGHEHACGGNINKEDFEEFIKRLRKFVK